MKEDSQVHTVIPSSTFISGKIATSTPAGSTRMKMAGTMLVLFLLNGCANYGTPKNIDIPDPRVADTYSLHNWILTHNDEDIRLILTFSGGGTRAAALSYGVMLELRNIMIDKDGAQTRLLDEIDFISSV
jgi:NTE family protein